MIIHHALSGSKQGGGGRVKIYHALSGSKQGSLSASLRFVSASVFEPLAWRFRNTDNVIALDIWAERTVGRGTISSYS